MTDPGTDDVPTAAAPPNPRSGLRARIRRLAPILVLAVAGVTAMALGGRSLLDPDSIAELVTRLKAEAEQAWAGPLFALAYASVAALSIPGAALLSLAGGMLFGTAMGTLWSTLGATAGATVLFFAVRSGLAPSLQSRAGGWTERLGTGFRRNAVTYLLLLRLIPAVPFFVVNLVPGLFGVRPLTFVWTTAVGILPGGFAYASLGAAAGVAALSEGGPRLDQLLTSEAVAGAVVLAILAVCPFLYRMVAATPLVGPEGPPR